MSAYPEDFSFQFRWQMGSVPPPYYYEYTIRVNPDGSGDIVLLPDYPENHPQKRTAVLQLKQANLEYLFQEMQKADLFEKTCVEVDSNWVGGSRAALNVRAWEKDFRVPYSISLADERRLEPVFLSIQEIIPAQLLNGLPG